MWPPSTPIILAILPLLCALQTSEKVHVNVSTMSRSIIYKYSIYKIRKLFNYQFHLFWLFLNDSMSFLRFWLGKIWSGELYFWKWQPLITWPCYCSGTTYFKSKQRPVFPTLKRFPDYTLHLFSPSSSISEVLRACLSSCMYLFDLRGLTYSIFVI